MEQYEVLLTAPAPLRQLHSLLRQKGLEAPAFPAPASHPPLATGFDALDRLLGGGIPRGQITQIAGRLSTGGTALAFSLLRQATRQQEVAAYLDAADSFDPASAEAAGIVLDRLLWVRGGPVEKTWQAANLVVDAGGFGLITVDLAGVYGKRLREWRERSWVRVQRAIEHTPAAVLLLAGEPLAGSAAGLVLETERERVLWEGRSDCSLLLNGLATRVRVAHQRRRLQWGGTAATPGASCLLEVER